ncbi:MAG: hypothetical protein CVT68_04665 [Actinobacteria bacterium HGW-Actinobacteria-8]|nr:MAG: hypothetical protein CVT68_04665 [Actinobacteria bacterium HGW-Actinobacteria-8]
MSESTAADLPFGEESTAGAGVSVHFRPLESRRIRRARLEAAEVAMELGKANPPIGAPIKRDAHFGAVFSDADNEAGTEPEPV